MHVRALLLSALVLGGCGSAATQKNATYFVPRSAMASLGSDVKVVGTHDSGLVIQAPDLDAAAIKAKSPQSFRFDQWTRERTGYDYSSMEKKIQQLVHDYPSLVKADVYGTTVEGRKEYVLTVGDLSDQSTKPQLMITGATHGNEIATVDVVLGLAERLLKGYATDQRIASMVKGHTIYFIPAVCVDSYVAETRENEDTDPNRSYPYPDDKTGHATHAIQDMIAFFKAHDIVGSIDFHSAASMIMFPWAYTYDHIPAADYKAFDDLTGRMAQSNGYEHGDIASTIYVAPGSSADYWYWTHHTTALGIELSHDYAGSHDPSDLIEENSQSTWTFIENFK